jgi:hypothetical protein
MRSAGQRRQHAARVGGVRRLSEDRVAEEHQRVGAESRKIGAARRVERLRSGEPAGGGFGALAGEEVFGDPRRRDDEGNAERGQDFRAPRRRGSEEEPRVRQ